MAELVQLWENAVLIVAAANEQSGWFDVSKASALAITKTHTTGTYTFEIDWSNDGLSVDTVETVAVTNNDTVEQAVQNKFARFRILCTTTTFTAHHTNVVARS